MIAEIQYQAAGKGKVFASSHKIFNNPSEDRAAFAIFRGTHQRISCGVYLNEKETYPFREAVLVKGK